MERDLKARESYIAGAARRGPKSEKWAGGLQRISRSCTAAAHGSITPVSGYPKREPELLTGSANQSSDGEVSVLWLGTPLAPP
jgi:hypothetical protein